MYLYAGKIIRYYYNTIKIKNDIIKGENQLRDNDICFEIFVAYLILFYVQK